MSEEHNHTKNEAGIVRTYVASLNLGTSLEQKMYEIPRGHDFICYKKRFVATYTTPQENPAIPIDTSKIAVVKVEYSVMANVNGEYIAYNDGNDMFVNASNNVKNHPYFLHYDSSNSKWCISIRKTDDYNNSLYYSNTLEGTYVRGTALDGTCPNVSIEHYGLVKSQNNEVSIKIGEIPYESSYLQAGEESLVRDAYKNANLKTKSDIFDAGCIWMTVQNGFTGLMKAWIIVEGLLLEGRYPWCPCPPDDSSSSDSSGQSGTPGDGLNDVYVWGSSFTPIVLSNFESSSGGQYMNGSGNSVNINGTYVYNSNTDTYRCTSNGCCITLTPFMARINEEYIPRLPTIRYEGDSDYVILSHNRDDNHSYDDLYHGIWQENDGIMFLMGYPSRGKITCNGMTLFEA